MEAHIRIRRDAAGSSALKRTCDRSMYLPVMSGAQVRVSYAGDHAASRVKVQRSSTQMHGS